VLHEVLGVNTREQLAEAARAGKLRRIPRFGAVFERKLLDALGKQAAQTQRFKISTAEDFARGLCDHLLASPGVQRVVVAGSFRRRKETVGDLDILVTGQTGEAIMDRFTAYDEVAQVLAKGPTRSTVRLKAGLQVDLRVVPEESYGAALAYFTGSKDHNIAVRRLGQAMGLKINEYGVFRGQARIGGRTEEDVYRAVGLPFIPPELRENRGEIEAAAKGALPRLIALDDIRGDLHAHTKASDGKSTLREMAEAARACGYDYVAITDHTANARVAHGLDADRLQAQLDEIDRLNETLGKFQVLKSAEVDILTDGKLDLPDRMLRQLDLAVCAIHSRFELGEAEQTQRLIAAMDNRFCSIIAHPTGRLIGERPGYAVDLEKVMEAAKDRGCALELNAHPSRLDLDDIHCRAAKAMGLKISLGSDAHSSVGLSAMRFGVDQARRGWLEPQDVLNTRPWSELKALLRR
jgi:DNA polymerase (family 10)